MYRKFVAVCIAVAALACFAGSAKADVLYFRTGNVVALDGDDRFTGAYDIQGVVTNAVPFHITVRIHDQFYPVTLHQGTIIKPTGTTLAPSMVVNVAGYWGQNGVFHANRIVVLRY